MRILATRCFVSLVLCASLVAAVGCSKSAKEARKAASSGSAEGFTVPSDDECQSYARGLETAFSERDVQAFNRSVDWESLFFKVTSNIPGSEHRLDSFRQGLRESIVTQGRFANSLFASAGEEGVFELVRVKKTDGTPRALFRFVSQTGMNYHELLLAKRNGEVAAVDVFVLLTGEWLSETLHRTALLAVQGTEGKSQGVESDATVYLSHQGDVSTMARSLREGEYREVVEVFQSLPESLKREKALLLMRHQAAINLGDEELRDALDDLKGRFPNDAFVDMQMMDRYILDEEYERALACVDRIDEWTGGDWYLDSVRANIYELSGELEQARKHIENALQHDPDNGDLLWSCVTITLRQKDHARTSEVLTLLEDYYWIGREEMAVAPEYADFFESEEGKAWLTRPTSAEAQ